MLIEIIINSFKVLKNRIKIGFNLDISFQKL